MTYDSIRRQYAANAEQLSTLADKAEAAGRKVRGATAAYWREKADLFASLGVADDATVAAHLAASQKSVIERLAELRTVAR